MEFVFDLISSINLLFCTGIVITSIWWTKKTDSYTPLTIGGAFLLFGISHLSLLLSLKDIFEPALVVLRVFAYLLVLAGFIFIARDVINRRRAEEEISQKHEDLNKAYEMLTADEEELKQNYDELQKAEDALRESEERYRALYDENPSIYFTLDSKGLILSVNNFGARQLEYSPDELKGKLFIDLFHPQNRENAEALFKKCLEDAQKPVYGEFQKMRKDGTVIWLKETMRAMPEGEGEMTVLVVSEDISEQKMAKTALDRATEKLSLLNTVTFTDIQNAVFSLHGYLELMKQGTSGEIKDDFIEKEIEIIRTIGESLAFAKKYQSLGQKSPEWQNAEQKFLFAISHLDLSKASITHSTNLGGLEIFADPLLEEVFFSLAENSVIHGNCATRISLFYQKLPGSLLLVYEDNGCGIHSDEKEKIFEKRMDKKTGLGLFLSREILSITDISIRERGEPGKGVRFEMTVPKGAYRFKDPDGS